MLRISIIIIGDGSCKCRFYGALYVGVVDTSMRMVGSWIDAEVVVKFVVVKGLMVSIDLILVVGLH